MKLIDREPTQEMLKAIAGADCAPSNYKRMFQTAYDAAPEVKQEPVAFLSLDCIGERYLCFSKPVDNDPVTPLYTYPPDAQAEITKRDARIETLEIRLSGFSDLTGLMQSSLEGDTSRISELLDQNEKQADEIKRLKMVIAKYADKENWNMDSCGVYRVWLEPDSDTPAAYNGWELALAAIKEIEK